MTARKPTRARGLGVTPELYAELLAAQGGGCAICGNPPKTRRLHVDHDHGSTDHRVRGLLCHRCNRALPNWITPKWLILAALYLMPDSPIRTSLRTWVASWLASEWPARTPNKPTGDTL